MHYRVGVRGGCSCWRHTEPAGKSARSPPKPFREDTASSPLVSPVCFTGGQGKRNLGFVAQLSEGLQEVEVRTISMVTVETKADCLLVGLSVK